jgi:hypothetical protein
MFGRTCGFHGNRAEGEGGVRGSHGRGRGGG